MNVLTRPAARTHAGKADQTESDRRLVAISRLSPGEACAAAGASPEGLPQLEVEVRQRQNSVPTSYRASRERRSSVNFGRARGIRSTHCCSPWHSCRMFWAMPGPPLSYFAWWFCLL